MTRDTGTGATGTPRGAERAGAAREAAFGASWRAGMYHDGRGLQHRPLRAARQTRAYTDAERAHLVKITDEADALMHRLYLRQLRADAFDYRLARIVGKAFARRLRRIWIGRQPYNAVIGRD